MTEKIIAALAAITAISTQLQPIADLLGNSNYKTGIAITSIVIGAITPAVINVRKALQASGQ